MAVIVALLAAAGAVTVLWPRSDRVPGNGSAAPQPAERPDVPLLPEAVLPLTLYVPVNGSLRPFASVIRRQPELQLELREAAGAVLSAEQAASAPVLKELTLRALYLDGGGTVYIDLSPGDRGELRSSAWDELLAVYALVNTLTQNFTEVRQVRLLVGGREFPTLAGHVDLSRAFVKRLDLVRPGEAEDVR